MINPNLQSVCDRNPVPGRWCLTAPNGTVYELVVSNTGTVAATPADPALLPHWPTQGRPAA